MPMTPKEAQVVDPILSTYAKDYKNELFVSSALFPRSDVAVRSGRIIVYGKESFMDYDLLRAPNSRTARVEPTYSDEQFSLKEESIEVPVARELASAASLGPKIDLGKRATDKAMEIIAAGLEKEAAAIARDETKYDNNHKDTLSGNDQWSNPSSTPLVAIREGRNQVRNSIGRYPNTLLLGANVFDAIRHHDTIRENFKYTTADSVTAEMLARLLMVDKVVVGMSLRAKKDGSFEDIWGNDAILAYTDTTKGGAEVPSFGRTYGLEGHPFMETPYYEEQSKSWIYGSTDVRQPLITAKGGGFLFRNAVAP